MKGLICEIYKYYGSDSSNNGISAKAESVTLVGEGIPEIFEPNDYRPAVKLVKRIIRGKEYVHAEPVEWESEGDDIRGMFGGTFIYTSDSRFPATHPIPLHDRRESREMYKRLSV